MLGEEINRIKNLMNIFESNSKSNLFKDFDIFEFKKL